MAQIDRTEKEKVLKIGPWKVKYGTVCVIGLLIILSFSSLAYLDSYLNVRANTNQTKTDNKIQVGLVISFDDNTSVSKTAQIDSGLTALFAFKEIANITLQDNGQSGRTATAVTAGNYFAENNATHSWYFYINGGINFRGLDLYTVNNGDVLELKFTKNIG